MPLEPIAVVGGDHGLGIHIIERLLQEGYCDIRCIGLQPFPNRRNNKQIGHICTSHVCDVSSDKESKDRKILCRALLGCTAVVCCLMPPLVSANETFTVQNLDCIRNLLEECRSSFIHSFVHISSIAVMNQFVSHLNVSEESPLPDISEYESPYDVTKRMGEDLMRELNDERLWSLSLRCGNIINSYHDLSGRFEKTNYLLYEGARMDTIDGVNVAWAVFLAVRALENRQACTNRECFFITKGEPMTLLEMSKMIQKRMNNEVVVVPVVVYQLIYFFIWFVLTIRSLLCLDEPHLPLHKLLLMANIPQTFSNKKIEEVLGYRPVVDMEATIDRVVSEYKESPQYRTTTNSIQN